MGWRIKRTHRVSNAKVAANSLPTFDWIASNLH